MSKMMRPISRRAALAGLAAAALLPLPALAFTEGQAKALIARLVADIQKVINSGKSAGAMYGDFERIFAKYGDSAVIGQLVLGADGRGASATQKRAFAKAFQGYMARKYGRRFREFIGGSIEVVSGRKVKRFYEVKTLTTLRGRAPFEVVFVVAEKNGKFIDMKIEGISLIKSERSEIGAMLDKRGGDLNRLIADLKRI